MGGLTCWVLHSVDHLIWSSRSDHGRISVRTIWRGDKSYRNHISCLQDHWIPVKPKMTTRCLKRVKKNYSQTNKLYHTYVTSGVQVCLLSFSISTHFQDLLHFTTWTFWTVFNVNTDACQKTWTWKSNCFSILCMPAVCVCINVCLCTHKPLSYWRV